MSTQHDQQSAIEASVGAGSGGEAWIDLERAAPQGVTERGVGTRKAWWLAAGALLVLAVAAVVTMRVTRSSKALVPLAEQRNIPLVSTLVPGLRPVSTEVMVTGSISARHDLPIGDGGQAGRIVAVYVQVGDMVRQGQILARLDDSVLKPQVAELAAALAKARAQAALAAAEYRRAVAIGPNGGLSAQDVEQLQAVAAMDAANTKMVAAQLQQKRAELALTRIVAPVAGTVLTRTAEVGQVASPAGPPLFTLEDQNRVELIGRVAEQDLAALKVGQPAKVYLIGYPRPFPGHIWLLGATVDRQTRLGEVRIALAPNRALRPGAFAHAVIDESHAERPVVPQTAVMTDSRGSFVFIVNRRNIIVRRAVQLGGVLASGVVIARGLTGRERVVTLAGGFLQGGEKVQVAPAAPRRS
ncbi:MAG: efflux RND transporter periplasmic adaptor subunit [Steroidobacteraceae bacterium]|jgi:RND family efflux transporter MFP subunit